MSDDVWDKSILTLWSIKIICFYYSQHSAKITDTNYQLQLVFVRSSNIVSIVRARTQFPRPSLTYGHWQRVVWETRQPIFKRVRRGNTIFLNCNKVIPLQWRFLWGADSVIWPTTKTQINNTSFSLAILYDTERMNKLLEAFYTVKIEIQFLKLTFLLLYKSGFVSAT